MYQIAQSHPGTAGAGQWDRHAPHLTLVDDDDALRDLVGLCLTDIGFAVTTCGSGIEALGILDRHRPDLVVTDVSMAPMDGVTLCREVRRAYGESLPVVLFTNCDIDAHLRRALVMPNVSYVAKMDGVQALSRHITSVLCVAPVAL